MAYNEGIMGGFIMLDKDRKLRLEHTPPARLVDRGIEVSEERLSLLYSNPCIRSLPKMASLYGLYGTFIIGHSDIFFACGLSHETIHQKKIVEGSGWVFPEEILQKTGFWPDNLICRDFCAFKLHGPDTDIGAIIQYMIAFELVIYGYRRFQMPVPQFFYMDNDVESQLIKLNLVQDNKMLISYVKGQAMEGTREVLENIAVPEWPITSKSEKPGFLAYLLLSAYTIGTTDDRKEKNNYAHQERWDETFRKNLSKKTGDLFVVQQDVADYLFKELDQRHIVYHVAQEKEKDVKARRESDKMLHDVMYRISGGSFDMDMTEQVKFSVHLNYTGIVNYLIERYSVSKYTPEEVEYGNYLYFTGTKERQAKEGPDCIGGCYLFYLPSPYENLFRREAGKLGIRLGSPAGASWTHMDAEGGRWYVVDLPDMPATEFLLHEMNENAMRTHFASVFDDAQAEYRMFDPGDLVILSSREQIYGKNSDVFSYGVLQNPIIEYTRKRMLVNNDPNPKSEEDFENFRCGTHLPYYKPDPLSNPSETIRKIDRSTREEALSSGNLIDESGRTNLSRMMVNQPKSDVTRENGILVITGRNCRTTVIEQTPEHPEQNKEADWKQTEDNKQKGAAPAAGRTEKQTADVEATAPASPAKSQPDAPVNKAQAKSGMQQGQERPVWMKYKDAAEKKVAEMKKKGIPIPPRYIELLGLDEEQLKTDGRQVESPQEGK